MSVSDSLLPRRFRSFEEARGAFNRALPDFKCPACGDEHQAMLGEFEQELRTKITLQTDADGQPVKFVPTLVLVCENCGHVSTFAEDGIRRLSDGRSMGDR